MITPDRPARITDEQREQLSAYLDGMLSPAERQALEQELSQDPALQRELNSLKATRDLLRSLPELRAPRDLRLTPAMVRARPAQVLPIPIYAALSAAAAFILIMAGILSLPPAQTPTAVTASEPQSIGALVTAAEAISQPTLSAATAMRSIEATETADLTEDGIAAQAEDSGAAPDQMQISGLTDAQPEALAEIAADAALAAPNAAAGIAPVPGGDPSRIIGGITAEPARGAATFMQALPTMLQPTARLVATTTPVATDTSTLIPTETPLPTVQPTMTLVDDAAPLDTVAIAPQSTSSFPTISIVLIAAGVGLGLISGILLLRSRR